MSTRRARSILVGTVAAATLLLGACGGDDDGAAPTAGGEAATDTPAGAATEPASATRTGPSAGLQLDDGWPEEVWIPTDVDVYGGHFTDIGDGTYAAQALGYTAMTVEEMQAAIEAGNGPPSEARDHASGGFLMEYPDLLAGNDVSFMLIADAADGKSGLTVGIGPK